jgi:hypothetical protein
MPRRRFRLVPTPEGTQVMVHTDLALSGAVAQYGRGVGIVQTTAGQLMNQFAEALRTQLAQQSAPAIAGTPADAPPQPAAPAAPAKPISGFSLMWQVLWESFRRLFGGGDGKSHSS